MGRNSTQLEIALKDLVTPGLRNVIRATQKADDIFAKLESHSKKNIAGVGHSISSLTRKIDELRAKKINTIIDSKATKRDIREAERDIQRLIKQRDKLDGIGAKKKGGMSGAFALGSLKANAYMMAAQGVARAGRAVVSGGARKEQNITGLRTFVGGQAEGVYSNIEKDAKATPFDTESLLSVNRSLISAGVSANVARGDALALANAISAVGGGNDELSRMAANMQQIKTVGKATAMDIKQFGMAGINIYQLLADSTGKSINEVKSMEVTYDQLSAALRKAQAEGGMYAGAMEAQSKTLTGRFNTFMDGLSLKAASLGEKLAPALGKLLDGVSAFIDSPAVQMFVNDLGTAFSDALGSIIELGKSLMPLLGPVLKIFGTILKLAGSLLKLLLPMISAVINMVNAILNPVLEVINKVIGKLRAAIDWVVDFLGIKGREAGHNFSSNIKTTVESSGLSDFMMNIGRKWGEAAVYGMNSIIQAKGFNQFAAYDPFGAITKSIKGAIKPTGSTGLVPAAPKLGPSGAGGGGKVGGGAPRKIKNAASNSITSGGTRTINIQVGKFFDDINISTATLKEGANEIERIVLEALNRTLSSATNMQ